MPNDNNKMTYTMFFGLNFGVEHYETPLGY